MAHRLYYYKYGLNKVYILHKFLHNFRESRIDIITILIQIDKLDIVYNQADRIIEGRENIQKSVTFIRGLGQKDRLNSPLHI